MQLYQVQDDGTGKTRSFHTDRCAVNWWMKAYPQDPQRLHAPQEVRRTRGECLWCYWCGEKAFDGDDRGCPMWRASGEPPVPCDDWNYWETWDGEVTHDRLVEVIGEENPLAFEYALKVAYSETGNPDVVVERVMAARFMWDPVVLAAVRAGRETAGEQGSI